MKTTEKKLWLIGAGLVVLGGLGIIFHRKKGNQRWDKDSQFMDYQNAKKRKEKLEWVRNKLEMHKARLDKHLEKINKKINAGSPVAPENV